MTAAAPLALVFPGQGCQRLGMGRDFHDAFAESRAVFEEGSDACGLDIAALCFDDEARLALTEFQQPAILTVETAMTAALRAHFGLAPTLFGGHSLGEYTALVAAGAMSLGDAARIVRLRGRLMQEAVPPGQGAMSAILRRELDADALRAYVASMGVDVANHNALDQAVISGSSADVARAVEALRNDEAWKVKAIALRVSAPFHSRYMQPVVEPLSAALEEVPFLNASAAATVACNATGGFHDGTRDGIIAALARQVVGTVRWVDNMRAIAGAGPEIVEVGPGRPLRGFFASIGRTVPSVHTVEAAGDVATRRAQV